TVPTTKTEAKRVESKLLQDLINGKFEILKKKENPRFRSYAEEYRREVTWQKAHRRTGQHIDRFVSVFGDKCLTEITTKDFLRYRADRLTEVSHGTINREYACLKRMLNVAIHSDEYLLNKNPLDGVKKLPEAPVENRELEPWEYHQLLDAAPEYFRRIMYFACNVGTRKQETLSLQWKQVKLRDIGSEIEMVEQKSNKRDMVPVHDDVIEMLKQIAQERGINLERMTTEQEEDYVFYGTRGIRLFDVRKVMTSTFKNAGIKQRDFHTFRHFWTTEMFNAGVPVPQIQKIGRWGDMKTMLRYCHTRKAQEFDAVNALRIHLGKGSGNIVAMPHNLDVNSKE
ncbi:tyrosine-type recombinase/integrase, partial [candidate division KSB1 bacterium]|nr:tyrosine-type recombinase/integrase [candidate division KSB1 bacterium]